MIKLIIFDLDDVLYPEIEYIKSGFRIVSEILSDNSEEQNRLFLQMINLFNKDRKNVFDVLVSEFTNLNQQQKINLTEKMLQTYRNHRPVIKPYEDTIPTLNELRKFGFKLGILSDGRGISQELKIETLGLEKKVDKIILTDLLGPNKIFWKPNPYAFQFLVDYFKMKPFEACYVGDNITKDFHGPNSLGMNYILISRPNGLYNNIKYNLKEVCIPTCKINSLIELLDVIPKLV